MSSAFDRRAKRGCPPSRAQRSAKREHRARKKSSKRSQSDRDLQSRAID